MRASSISFALALSGLAALASFAGCGGSGDTVSLGGTSTSASSSGAGGSAGGGGQGGGSGSKCGDGKVESPEDCDDGNTVLGDGCENDCSFTCTKGSTKGDAFCDDMDACNGVETCGANHACTKGTALADGSSCGAGKVCKMAVCGDAVCGDGFVTPPEECDDGNLVNGDGCDSCKFSCTSGTPGACTPMDSCAGIGTCDDATHTCSAGVPLADGTACPGGFCKAGMCAAAMCGNGVVDPGEQCDDGNATKGDGCEPNCTFSCAVPVTDCPAPPVCEIAACDANHVCTVGADASQDGKSCGGTNVCKAGACSAPSAVCGNGVKEAGEDCDFGAGNGPGTGCEANCKFSCTTNPDSCPDANTCNGTEACGAVMVGGKAGQKCSAGVALANCTACNGGLCIAGSCAVSKCGDGCVNAGAGEQCEPPNTPTCDATCKTIVVAVCGNGVRDAGEQCDDGNVKNLDGCSAVCKFEQDQRVDYLKMQYAADAYCTADALGAAISGGTAQGQIQTSLDNGIKDGSITIIFEMLSLDDLTGTADPMLSLGVLNGKVVAGGAYNGNADLDWWYTTDPLSIDANRNPLTQIGGSILAKVLNAGPGAVALSVTLGGSPAVLKMSNAKLQGTIGATSAPLMSAGATPGHLAGEHLDPALVSFAGIGQQTANGSAKLCGNVSADSLKQVPIPAALVGNGLLNCSAHYAATNTLLDVLIGGCTILGIQQIKPTQPDQSDPNAPVGGAGGPYKLAENAAHSVTTCTDKNNAMVPLATCLSAAAYSSFFKFATDRVIAK